MNKVLLYPGSKWKIANHLVALISEHKSYLEPFFGSGAVFFQKPPSAIETINDIEHDVVNLFECIQADAERLARQVMTTPFSREVYDSQFPAPEFKNRFDKAAAFLVRSWQGHGFRLTEKVGWRTDVIGRVKMFSLWDWYKLPESIISVAERLRTVQIENRPAVELIKRYDSPNTFIYLDPPYLLSTRTRKQYMQEMTDEAEHEELLETVKHSNAQIMLSGYESELYNNALRGWEKETFQTCAQSGNSRTEVVWMNYKRQMSIADFPEILPGAEQEKGEKDEII